MDNKQKLLKNPSVTCENCGYTGHTIDRCFKIIGCPENFNKKKSGGNKKVFNNNSVVNSNQVVNGNGPSSSQNNASMPFTPEQIMKFMSLNGDKTRSGNIQSNMPEYCVNLISIYKLARDSKFFIGFDENSRYIDLGNMTSMGT
ncbi:hypothetical protein Tco_0238687, partial [Tanacetum coccineum]